MIIGIWIDTPALGDTIAAIPTCKKISEAYQTKVAIFTTHPQIFIDQPWALCVQHPRSIETFTDIKIHRIFKVVYNINRILFEQFNFFNNIRFEIFFQNNPLLFFSYNNLHIYM